MTENHLKKIQSKILDFSSSSKPDEDSREENDQSLQSTIITQGYIGFF